MSHLYSSNNLTIVEPVVLHGRGAAVRMEVGNRLPRSQKPLLFELLDRHLVDCNNPHRTFDTS